MIWNCLSLGAILDSQFQNSHSALVSVQILTWTQLVCLRAISEELIKALLEKLYSSHQNDLKSMIGHRVKSSFWRAKGQLIAEKLNKSGLPWQNRAELHQVHVHKEPSGEFGCMFLPMRHCKRVDVQGRECHLHLQLLGKRRRQAKNR